MEKNQKFLMPQYNQYRQYQVRKSNSSKVNNSYVSKTDKEEINNINNNKNNINFISSGLVSNNIKILKTHKTHKDINKDYQFFLNDNKIQFNPNHKYEYHHIDNNFYDELDQEMMNDLCYKNPKKMISNKTVKFCQLSKDSSHNKQKSLCRTRKTTKTATRKNNSKSGSKKKHLFVDYCENNNMNKTRNSANNLKKNKANLKSLPPNKINHQEIINIRYLNNQNDKCENNINEQHLNIINLLNYENKNQVLKYINSDNNGEYSKIRENNNIGYQESKEKKVNYNKDSTLNKNKINEQFFENIDDNINRSIKSDNNYEVRNDDKKNTLIKNKSKSNKLLMQFKLKLKNNEVNIDNKQNIIENNINEDFNKEVNKIQNNNNINMHINQNVNESPKLHNLGNKVKSHNSIEDLRLFKNVKRQTSNEINNSGDNNHKNINIINNINNNDNNNIIKNKAENKDEGINKQMKTEQNINISNKKKFYLFGCIPIC